jgi:hypothetical protein
MAGELLPPGPELPIGRQFTERLLFWKDYFAMASQTELHKNSDFAYKELDELWKRKGLMREEFLVSGYGQWTELIADTDENFSYIIGEFPIVKQKLVAREGYVSLWRGKSLGINSATFADSENLELTYHFHLSEETQHKMTSSIFMLGFMPVLQIKVGTLSLVPYEPLRRREELGSAGLAKEN